MHIQFLSLLASKLSACAIITYIIPTPTATLQTLNTQYTRRTVAIFGNIGTHKANTHTHIPTVNVFTQIRFKAKLLSTRLEHVPVPLCHYDANTNHPTANNFSERMIARTVSITHIPWYSPHTIRRLNTTSHPFLIFFFAKINSCIWMYVYLDPTRTQ